MGLSFLLSLALLSLPLGNTTARPAGADWLPLDPATLSATAPTVEKDADAEAIFWDVRVHDDATTGSLRTVLQHYIRIKIFTERGKEKHGQVEIPYLARTRVSDIAGRTIKPDGSIVELKNDAIFDRMVVKQGDLKVRVKSFAMPAVEPGAVIEYRWKEIRNDALSLYIRLQLQREIPVRKVTYHLKPLSFPGFTYGMRTLTFNGHSGQFVKESGGFYATTLENVPAFKEEPSMPAEEQVRPWILVYYAPDHKKQPEQYWNDLGKEVHNSFKNATKINDEIREAADEIVGDAATDDQKLERIYDFCRTKIKNVSDDAAGLSEDDYKKMKENKNPSDTLKRKMGTDSDVSYLFAALAAASGFETRLAYAGNQNNAPFNPGYVDPYLLDFSMIAVKVGDVWRFVDPTETYLPYGMLYWGGSGQPAFLADPKASTFYETPVSARDRSVERRTARLALSEDGTLEGDVRVEYTGHLARARKEFFDDETPENREKLLEESVTERISTAEVSNVKLLNVQDPNAPCIVEYHVRVPGYAQRTGKRLFVQPAFFQYNVGPRFPAADRKHQIRFSFGWTEQDEVVIELPDGFELDHADAPESFGIGQAGGYDVKLSATDDGRTIKYTRSFAFGGPNLLLFGSDQYPQIKKVFDTLHERDRHALTLKQAAK